MVPNYLASLGTQRNVSIPYCSEEKEALLKSELESAKEAAAAGTAGEASNLSFELTEADLYVHTYTCIVNSSTAAVLCVRLKHLTIVIFAS